MDTEAELLKYKELGIESFVRLGRASKVPCTPMWVLDSRDEILRSGHNAGFQVDLALTKCVIIDVDARHGGLELWKHFQIAHDLPDTAKVLTSEGGFHAYYKIRDDEGVNFNRTFENGALSIIHRRKYVVAAGSTHPSGVFYQWEDLEAEFEWAPVEFCRWLTRPKKKEQHRSGLSPHPRAFFSRAVRGLPLLDPCMGYEEWIRVGMALHSSGYGDEAFEAWKDWSAKCPDKFNEQSLLNHWKSFGECENPITMRTLEWMIDRA